MDLRAYLAALGRRRVLIAGALLLSILGSIGMTLLIPPTYRAGTTLFVSTDIDGNNANQQLFQGGSFSVDRVKSYAELAVSPLVLEPVIQQLELGASSSEIAKEITTSVPAGTVLLELQVVDRSPDRAAALTNAVGARLAAVVEELESPGSGQPSPVKVSILEQATPPVGPVWPNPALNIAVGVLVGLAIGVGLALLLDSLDVTVKNAEDLARATTLPVLATVALDPSGTDTPIVRDDASDRRSEAFRQLRTNLQFAAVDATARVLVVTSAMAGEGKSSVAGNLAMSLQQLGLRVCLVDGDLRRPSVADYFGLVGESGLTTVLIGRAELDHVLQSAAPGLDVITSGSVPPNPGELLASGRMSTVLEELSRRYDTVIIDTPPSLPVADAAAMAGRADGILYVVRVGKTTRHQVTLAIENLNQVKARMLGVVLNMAPAKSGRGDYYQYAYSRPAEAPTSDSPAVADQVAGDDAVRPRPTAEPAATRWPAYAHSGSEAPTTAHVSNGVVVGATLGRSSPGGPSPRPRPRSGPSA